MTLSFPDLAYGDYHRRRRGDQAAEVNVTKQPDGGPTFHHSTVAGLAVFKTTNRLASVRLAVLDRC